jgi:predicted dehydrogenase
MQSRIRVGVIGAGSIAQTTHLPLLARMPDFTLAGICDTNRATIANLEQRYRTGFTATDYRDFVNRPEFDAVIVATPTDMHHPIAMAALTAGKHVLVEKPMTRTHAEASALHELARKKDLILMAGMNHRFRTDITALKHLIRHDEIGSIFSVQATWLQAQPTRQRWRHVNERAGGGVFMDLGIVLIDLVLWLLDFPDVRTVSASMFHHRTKTVEDSASCYFRAGEETAVQIVTSWNAMADTQRFTLDMLGSRGSVTLNPLRIFKLIAGTPVNVTPVLPDPGPTLFRRSYEHELRHFAGAIRRTHPVISSAEEAMLRMKIVDGAYASAREGKEILLTPKVRRTS